MRQRSFVLKNTLRYTGAHSDFYTCTLRTEFFYIIYTYNNKNIFLTDFHVYH